MAGKLRHLLHRDGRYSARVAVPESLRKIVGKREMVEALGADRTAALRKLPGVVARLQATIDAARGASQNATTRPAQVRGRPMSARQMARVHYANQMEFDQELRNTTHLYSHGFVDDHYVSQLRRAVTGSASNDEMLETMGRIVAAFQARGNTKAQFGTPEWREVARALAVAELESLARTAERDEGDFNGKPTHPELTEVEKPIVPNDPATARIIGPESTKPLVELLPTFINERGATPGTNYECQVAVRMLDEFLGEQRPVLACTRFR